MIKGPAIFGVKQSVCQIGAQGAGHLDSMELFRGQRCDTWCSGAELLKCAWDAKGSGPQERECVQGA